MIIKLKQQLVKTSLQLVEKGLVVATWGNLSIREEKEKVFVITPSGMSYEKLNPEDMVTLDFDGNVLEGKRKPSTETPLHLEIYKAREDVKAIIHTHSIFASACAVSRIAIPPVIEDLASMVGGSVDVADYALAGSKELAKNALKALGEKNAVLLANHGVIAVGPTVDEAFKTACLVEKAACIFINAHLVGVPKMIAKEDVKILRNYYVNKYGQK